MALKGNLRDFSITQLLNLINIVDKSGALYLEGTELTALIYFNSGKVSFAHMGEQDIPLLSVLAATKQLKRSQVVLLEEKYHGLPDKELGICLINAGYLSQDEIISALKKHYSDLIRQLFGWEEGYFHFESGEGIPEGRIPVRLELANLIVEGARNLQEYEQLKEEIPSLDMALKFTERPGTNIRDINLSVEEWRVVSYVNPKNTMTQISKATHLNDLEIRRVVYALLQAGLVEIIRPGGTPVSLPGKTYTPAERDEQKTLVNRLIDRIRSI